MKLKHVYRVDIQVAIMTSCIVALSSALIFISTYMISYDDMIRSLQDRVSAIYYGLEHQIEEQNFTSINTKDDMALTSYQEIQRVLLQAKETTGVMYLYTAKELEDGSFVYVVDGLSPDSADFRCPGDLIEPEIQDEMKKALTAEIVMPKTIQHTSWGDIFIAYMPITQGDEVLGVLGIEFDVGHQYDTYRNLLFGMIALIIFFCIFASFVSFKLFRRISNPMYKDLTNTDFLSGAKNRNAFETDIHNLNRHSKSAVALLSIDLDNLKVINDAHGHRAGDQYIISCVDVLQHALLPNSVLYRVGGDEFAIIIRDVQPHIPQQLIEQIQSALTKRNAIHEQSISLTIGHATYNDVTDGDLLDTLQRADTNMYQSKRIKKERITVN